METFGFILNSDKTVSVYRDHNGQRYGVDRFKMPRQCRTLTDFRRLFFDPVYNLGKYKLQS